MKRLLICAALFCALTLLTACDNIDMPDTVGTHTVSDPSASSGDTQLFTIEGQYLATRTGHMVIHGGEPYTISAANDKVEFSSLTDGDIIRVTIDGIRETYPGQVTAYSVEKLSDGERSDISDSLLDNLTSMGWLAASKKYTDEYFSAHDLYLLVLEEGSGSVRHEITGISNGVATLKRHVPEVVTDDMAEWHIFIEVNKGETLSGISDGNSASRACDVYTVSEVTAALDKALDKTKQQYRNLHSG